MTLVQVTIGHACTQCRECEAHLPGILEDVAKYGSSVINPLNPHVDIEALASAVHACPVAAIMVGIE